MSDDDTPSTPEIIKALSELIRLQDGDKDLPFIVIGHGNEEEKENNSGSLKVASIHNQDENTDHQLEEIACKWKAPAYAEVPWSKEKIMVDEYDEEVILKLPRNTQIIGRASSDACLVPDSSFKLIHFDGEYGKRIRNLGLDNVSGIIYPTKIPKTNDVPCSHLCKYIFSSYVDLNHFVHTGICLDESTTLRTRRYCPQGMLENNTFRLLSDQYVSIPNGENSNIIHEPYKFKRRPKDIEVLKDTDQVAIKVKIVLKPFIILTFISLVALPGLFQGYGSEDNDWGDIINAIISTGPVAFAMAKIYVNTWGRALFNMKLWSRGTIRRVTTTTNEWVARNFAAKTVREIERMACDPNLPAGLIADDRNSAVRAQRNGWLSIGNRIPLRKLINHGYVVFKEKCMVLDLVEGEFYQVCKNGPSAAVIIRNMEEYDPASIEPLDGNEVFEIPARRNCKKLRLKCRRDFKPED